jgi:glycosyltransferase involved in cell wall biosynthesis
LHIGRALQACGAVEVVVVDAEGGGDEWAELSDKEFNVAYGLPVHQRPKRGLGSKLRWSLDPRMNYPHGLGVDDEALERVLASASRSDVIFFCKLRTPNMFPRWAWARSVADVDDVPSTYMQSVLRTETGLRRRLRAVRQYWSWRRRDQLLGERFSVLGVCSETDKRYLQSLGVKAPLHVIPNGFERSLAEPHRNPAVPPRIGFVGILDYEPNLAGIRWFAQQCWPRIKQAVPDARLRLMGRHSDGTLKPAGPDIDGLGWVADAADEIATWSAMVVPIHLGAGTRGKIAHAFSLKCPVVSTSLGAYGFEVVHGRELFLADSAETFAKACITVMRQPADAALVAERAWQQFLERWTWDAIRPRIWAAVEDCLRRAKTP